MAPTPPNVNLATTELTDEMREAELARGDEVEAGRGTEDADVDAGDAVTREARVPGEEQRQEPAPRQMSPSDAAREAIANKFKRPGAVIPFDGDMTKPENLYGEVASEQLEPDPDAPEPGVPQDRTARAEPERAEPRMITRVVRGKSVTRSEDEWLELASKVDAADSYLEESRALLQDAKSIRAERAGRDPQHPEGQTSTQDDGQESDRTEQARHPGPDLKSVVEKIQFGDPEEAARELGQVIASEATKQANEGHISRLIQNDLARSQKALSDFLTANAELAKDKTASVVIENNIYDIFREEIQKLGIEEAQIPKDPKSLADWHRFYRVHGHPVSNTPDVLKQAKGRFDEWRGASPQPKPAVRREGAPARVAVNVERTDRRMAIPNQPSRAVAPRRDAQQAPAKSKSSDVVAEMRRSRGQPV